MLDDVRKELRRFGQAVPKMRPLLVIGAVSDVRLLARCRVTREGVGDEQQREVADR